MEKFSIESWGFLGSRLQGQISGRKVLTSSVTNIKDRLVYTQNSVYELGQPDKEYEDLCNHWGWNLIPESLCQQQQT